MRQKVFTAILILTFCFVSFAQTAEVPCPTINVSISDFLGYNYQILIFSVEINKEIENSNAKYDWTITDGKLLAGQGTKSVAVLREYDSFGKASVEINDLPKSCKSNISEKFPQIIVDPPFARKVDEYEKVTQREEKERLDNLFADLKNNPNDKGLIKLRSVEKQITHLKFLSEYIISKGYNDRTSFMVNSGNEKLNELWRIPAGANMPDCKDCIIIRAEDFDKLEKLFQPKPITKNRKK